MTDEAGEGGDVEALEALVAYLMPRLGLNPECELGVTLVDVEAMSALNEQWMGEPGPTDVLSFPIDELRSAPDGSAPSLGVLGDIVLCPAFARAQAAAAGRTLDAELDFLVVHGMLHLIGYDHASQSDYDAMFAMQDDLLAGWAGPIRG